MKNLSLSALLWRSVTGIALVIIGFDIVRARELSNLGDLGRLILLDLPIVAGLGLLLAVIFHFVGQLHRTLEKRNSELLALHEAALDIAGELDLDVVLQRVAERARQLVGAKYGALAVYEASGRIESFLTSGITREQRQQIGPPPQGKGLLGAVLREGEVIRVSDLHRHPRAAGFPAGHPQLQSLLAVPIASRPPWRGNLYLADKEGASEFDSDDERSLKRFAAQAALAIDTAHTHRQLRELAIAEERQRIAHEMHDGLAQVLASVIAGTQAVREYLRSGRTEEASRQLDQLTKAANETYTETREGILALRAAAENTRRPLAELLADYLADWQDRTGILVRGRLSPGVSAPLGPELQIMRIAQEALANVRKHSGARSVDVALSRDAVELCLTVSDDGSGFDPERTPQTGSPRFGIATMRERAQSIGGRLELSGAPGRGTTVGLRVPLRPREAWEVET